MREDDSDGKSEENFQSEKVEDLKVVKQVDQEMVVEFKASNQN